jgi:hypothetical protein
VFRLACTALKVAGAIWLHKKLLQAGIDCRCCLGGGGGGVHGQWSFTFLIELNNFSVTVTSHYDS